MNDQGDSESIISTAKSLACNEAEPENTSLLHDQEQQQQEQEQPTEPKPLQEILARYSECGNDPWIWQQVFKWRFYIIVFWICFILPIGWFYHEKFIEATDSTFSAIKGTESYDGQEVYEDNYLPESNDYGNINAPIIVFLQTRDKNESMTADPSSELYKETKSFVLGYAAYMETLSKPGWIHVDEYYTLYDDGLYTVATDTFTREDGRYMVMNVNTLIETSDMNDFIDDLKDYGDKYVPSSLTIGYTGMSVFQQDMIKQAKEDTAKMDLIVLPLALFVLCYILEGNVAIMLIPVTMIFTTMGCWGMIMHPVAKSWLQVTQTTPSIMSSMSIAMGIDYSLFILSRAQEELKAGVSEHKAVVEALNNAGFAILVSGSTIVLCLFGLMLLPMDQFISLGLGAGIAVTCCLVVNLTLVPAILFTKFGKRLLNFSCRSCLAYCCCCFTATAATEEVEEPLQEPLLENNQEADLNEEQSIVLKEDDPEELKNGLFFRLGRNYVHHPNNTIIFLVITLCFILPCAVFLPQMETSISNQLNLPSDSDALDVYDDISEIFGAGYINPYKLIFDGSNANKNITTQEGFDVMHLLYQDLLQNADNASPEDNYEGIAVIENEPVSYHSYLEAINCAETNISTTTNVYSTATIDMKDVEFYYENTEIDNCTDNEFYDTINYYNARFTANDQVTYIFVTLAIDPYSVDGVNWLTSTRDIIQDMEDAGTLQGFQVYMQGGAGVIYDSQQKTYESFPMMIGVSCAVVFLVIAVAFKSIAAPCRLIITVVYTLLFCFGLAVLIYQKGLLDWLGIRSLGTYTAAGNDSSDGELSWLPPVMAFTVITGLSLDYDVFLMTRIFEFRHDKYYHKSSILLGLESTGHIITAAGVIMAIAFGGLLASTSLVLNQYGLMLTASVILDTFVIRTILVPILLSYAGRFAWWPSPLPTEEKSLLPEEEGQEEQINDDENEQLLSHLS